MKPIHDLRIGEIFVGGEGLSRGYWNRPELTAQKFLQVEVEPGVMVRLYRTGDLGRYNQAGLLEFVGRTDFQVKVRGYRVEPEEIELALSSMPGLAAAAVVARGRTAESKQLCCCFVPERAACITPEAIKSFLKLKFPDYMVPVVFRELALLPRNTNDKVDRKQLETLLTIPAEPVQFEEHENLSEAIGSNRRPDASSGARAVAGHHRPLSGLYRTIRKASLALMG